MTISIADMNVNAYNSRKYNLIKISGLLDQYNNYDVDTYYNEELPKSVIKGKYIAPEDNNNLLDLWARIAIGSAHAEYIDIIRTVKSEINLTFKKAFILNNFGNDPDFDSIDMRTADIEEFAQSYENFWTKKFFDLLLDFKFVPGGRINFAVGRKLEKQISAFNCYFIPFPVLPEHGADSLDAIYECIKNTGLTYAAQGGVGNNLSALRPRGASLRDNTVSPGAVAFMDLISINTNTIAQYGRRGANMQILSIWHPDIEHFIDIKNDKFSEYVKELSKYDLETTNSLNMEYGDRRKVSYSNISILISNKFMEAVINNDDFDLVYPDYDTMGRKQYNKDWDGNITKWIRLGHPVKVYKTIKARELWNKVIKSAWRSAEPGVIFEDQIRDNWTVNKPFNGVNPCITGDTKIAVADGRNAVPIKQLAKEKKPIPVYCVNDLGELKIEYMRNPRLTRKDVEIYEILLDDGSKIKCTANHKFYLRDNTYIEARHLKKGNSFLVRRKWQTNLKEIFKEKEKETSNYWQLNTGKKNIFEHRLIYEEINNSKINKGEVIHHKDFDSLNNHLSNLKLMTKEEHDAFHDISGDNNPMRKWFQNTTEERRNEYRKNISEATSGEKNGRYSGYTNEKLLEIMIKIIKKSQIPLSTTEWVKYAKINNFPQHFSKFRGTIVGLVKKANQECNFKHFDDHIVMREYRRYHKLKREIDTPLHFEDGVIRLKKRCPLNSCGQEFLIPLYAIDRVYCSNKCTRDSVRGKGAKTNHNRAIEQRIKIKIKIIDLLEEYVSDNSRVPSTQEFFKLLKENNINDLRTAGINKGYKFILRVLTDKYKVEEINTRKLFYNTNNYNQRMGKNLLDHGLVFNHKVVSVNFIGKDDVYNATVDTYHNYGIILNEKETASGNPSLDMVFTRNCAEINLSDYEPCDLGHVALDRFVNLKRFFDFDGYSQHIKIAIRLLDNIHTINEGLHALPQQKDASLKFRRVGLGITGLGDTFIRMGIEYDSPEAVDLSEKLAKLLLEQSLIESINLAKEKGAFPEYDEKDFLKAKIMEKFFNENPKMLESLKSHGIRNCAINTIAPVGSGSIIAQCSSGIEPLFNLRYERKVKKSSGEGYDVFITYERVIKELFGSDTNLPDFAKRTAHKISSDFRLDLQSVWQKYIMNSISSTVNLPEDVDPEVVSQLYINAYKKGLKGITVYREGSRAGILTTYTDPSVMQLEQLKHLSHRQQVLVEKLIKEGEEDKVNQIFATYGIESGYTNGEEPFYPENWDIPKRPNHLSGYTVKRTAEGKKWYITLNFVRNGVLDELYEVFATTNNEDKEVDIKPALENLINLLYSSNIEKSLITKQILASQHQHIIDQTMRMLSLGLRHKIPLEDLVECFDIENQNVTHFTYHIMKILTERIPEGTKSKTICSQCNDSALEFSNGCYLCKNCGYTKC